MTRTVLEWGLKAGLSLEKCGLILTGILQKIKLSSLNIYPQP